MTEYRQPQRTCIACGFVTNVLVPGFGNPDAPEPKEGDFKLCRGCGTMTTLHGGEWKLTTQAELDALEPEHRQEITRMRLAVAGLRPTGFNPGYQRGGQA